MIAPAEAWEKSQAFFFMKTGQKREDPAFTSFEALAAEDFHDKNNNTEADPQRSEKIKAVVLMNYFSASAGSQTSHYQVFTGY